MIASFRVRRADWVRDEARLRQIRESVFVHEQAVPLALEWDGIDPDCAHVIAEDEQGHAFGTGRLLPDGHIGRMAVLREWRGQGAGSAILLALIAIAAEQGMSEVVLNAQTQARDFYARHDFVAEGDVFLDAGIPHQRMRRPCRGTDHGADSGAG
jgi:predicted GNAT family N-acyltransferase